MMLICVISLSAFMDTVFKFDQPSFECLTGNARYNSICPDNQYNKCREIIFDRTRWSANLVTDLTLICDRSWLISLPSYGWFVGMFLTTFTLQFPDYFGRAKVVFWSQGLLTMTLFLGAASKSIYITTFLRLLQGFSVLQVYNAMYTYYIEALPTKKRAQFGVLPDAVNALSVGVYASVGYIFRHWQAQSYALGTLNLIVLVFVFFLPESKLWIEIQQKTAKKESTYKRIKNGIESNIEQFRMIYRSPNIFRICLTLMPLWLAGPISWMVINFAVDQLFGDIFINVIVLGLADMAANTLLVLFGKFFRRQIITSISFGGLSLCFIVCFGLRLYETELTQKLDVAFMMLANFFASGKS